LSSRQQKGKRVKSKGITPSTHRPLSPHRRGPPPHHHHHRCQLEQDQYQRQPTQQESARHMGQGREGGRQGHLGTQGAAHPANCD
jgi:hypothetical protein